MVLHVDCKSADLGFDPLLALRQTPLGFISKFTL